MKVWLCTDVLENHSRSIPAVSHSHYLELILTPERAKELLPVIQAYAAGEEIECQHPGFTEWVRVGVPSWVEGVTYRVKPEIPQYRLFQYKSGTLGIVLRHRTINVLTYERYVQRNEGNWLTEWIPCPNIKLD